MRRTKAIPISLLFFAFRAVGCLVSSDSTEEIPFKYRDGLLWLEVHSSKEEKPLRFLLDSGAQVSVISERTAHRLGLRQGRSVAVDGVGMQSTGSYPEVLECRSGKTSLPQNFLRLNLDALSATCTNGAVDGIVGAEFFRNRIVEIDFENEVIRLRTQAAAEMADIILPLKVRRCGMLVPIKVNGAGGQWVRFDTGCASPLQWVTRSVPAANCSQRFAVALTRFSLPVTKTTVSLGGMNFENVPTDLHKEEIFPGEKGLLGNGLLSQFMSVTVDFRAKKLILKKSVSACSKPSKGMN